MGGKRRLLARIELALYRLGLSVLHAWLQEVQTSIELLHCIRKNQIVISKLQIHAETVSTIWDAVLGV
ncbi:MAG: hypothetical protein PHU07_04560 [Acidocella sp.]|nr:hypothetical protein [Acidocella sp.]